MVRAWPPNQRCCVTIATVQPSKPAIHGQRIPSEQSGRLSRAITRVDFQHVPPEKTRGVASSQRRPSDWQLECGSATIWNFNGQRVAQFRPKREYLTKPLSTPLHDRNVFKPGRIEGRACFFTYSTPFIRIHPSLSSRTASVRSIWITSTTITAPASGPPTPTPPPPPPPPPPPGPQRSTRMNSWSSSQPTKRPTARPTSSPIAGACTINQDPWSISRQLRPTTVSITVTSSSTGVSRLSPQSHWLRPPRGWPNPMATVNHHTLANIGRQLTTTPTHTAPGSQVWMTPSLARWGREHQLWSRVPVVVRIFLLWNLEERVLTDRE